MDVTQPRHPCPYCAEEIAAGAVRCPHCRSRLSLHDVASWHRDHPGRVLGGVAAAIARATALPVTLVRAGFVVLTFIHLLGPLVYGALWILLPEAAGAPSLLERALGRGAAALRRMRTGGGGRADAGSTGTVPRTPHA
jgi:phage shock protein PspC (stress-responsive transcriptional regulator)